MAAGAPRSLPLVAPLPGPGSDFGAVQTFSLTRQIDILCQPRDGAAVRDAPAGSSEVGWERGQGKEAAEVWSGLPGHPQPSPCPYSTPSARTGAPRHCPKGPSAFSASCQAGGRRRPVEGSLRNLREAPACTVTSYPCSQGWPPHPSGGKWAGGLQRRGGKKPATGWGNPILADSLLGVSGVLWTPSTPQLITLKILERCKEYAALCQGALVSGEMAPGESPLQTCSP